MFLFVTVEMTVSCYCRPNCPLLLPPRLKLTVHCYCWLDCSSLLLNWLFLVTPWLSKWLFLITHYMTVLCYCWFNSPSLLLISLSIVTVKFTVPCCCRRDCPLLLSSWLSIVTVKMTVPGCPPPPWCPCVQPGKPGWTSPRRSAAPGRTPAGCQPVRRVFTRGNRILCKFRRHSPHG